MHFKLLVSLILFSIISSGCSQQSIKKSNQLEYQSSKTTHKAIAVKLKKTSDLWSRLRKGLTLREHYDRQELDDKKHWDQDHQKYIDKITENGKPYIYHIINKLEHKNIPLELALLPAIESTYNALSYSSQHASGLWQFIPATARKQGLKQDFWYDARRDPIKSTDAAIEYLLYLYNRFDSDWLLTLAAYNGGEGTVRRSIRRNKKNGKSADFWSLKLPKETMSYVPRLLILSRIIASPKNQGGVFSFNIEKIHSHDVSTILDQEGIAVRGGHHCCQVLHEVLNINSSVRVSFGVYNNENDIEALCEGIEKCQNIFKKK